MKFYILLIGFLSSHTILGAGFDRSSLELEVKEANFFTNSHATMLTMCKVSSKECESAIDGYFKKGSSKAVSSDSIMLAGSISKYVSGALFMLYVERGYVSLDDQLTDYFPEYQLWKKVTVKHLLTHRSGLPAYLFSVRAVKTIPQLLKDRHRSWTPKEILHGISTSKLEFEPGSSGKYSNTNYLFLGMILEKVTGKKLAQLFDEDLIKPLGLTNTFYHVPETQRHRLVSGSVNLPNTKIASMAKVLQSDLPIDETHLDTTDLYNLSLTGAAGGLISNSIDIAKFTNALFNGEIVKLETLYEMMNNGDMMIGPTGYHDYGYGFEETQNRFGVLIIRT